MWCHRLFTVFTDEALPEVKVGWDDCMDIQLNHDGIEWKLPLLLYVDDVMLADSEEELGRMTSYVGVYSNDL